ncbi:hypothetical protein F442_10750 [Phytophthora nicotianae P10297]|uniref:Uncharacterized protein n=1 Tax=Phytophthora nicotianae P10297 TaxID=1317064 RepID=W2Z4Z2_PHYNI|nr:hypothetical protein F442_10750 [Phytophthora nicotianae P10297]
MSSIAPRSLAAALFGSDGDEYHQSRFCFFRRKQVRGTGCTNLVEHLDNLSLVGLDHHGEPQTEHVRKGEDAEVHSFEPSKHKDADEEHVRAGKRRPRIDAWTEEGTHFVAVIGVTGADKYLLCFSTLTGESDMGSDVIIELLDDVLDTYEIHASQLCFYVIDHASVNVAIANKTLVTMIGRASHRFNLAVQALMREDDDILDRVHALMVKLNTIKNRHHLREADALMPVYRNTTRWSSTFSMIDRYFRIYSKLDRIDDQLAGFIPTPRENVRLKAL